MAHNRSKNSELEEWLRQAAEVRDPRNKEMSGNKPWKMGVILSCIIFILADIGYSVVHDHFPFFTLRLYCNFFYTHLKVHF